MENMMYSAAAAFLLFAGAAFAASGEYDYSPAGPIGVINWGGVCGSGNEQSPINFYQGSTTYDASLANDAFNFVGYDREASGVKIKNSGHSINIEYGASTVIPTVSGGGLGASYTAAQFHMHWGSTNDRGSEHTINNQAFPMELHIVHFKTSSGTISNALTSGDRDALAVLGFMFEVGDVDNTAWADIVSNLEQIKTWEENGPEVALNPFVLNDLLPTDFSGDFYRYMGGLTTPTCNEQVRWTVFNKPIKISATQMEAFRQLIDSNSQSMNNNYRPVQDWNLRSVQTSIDYSSIIKWGYTPQANPGGANEWPNYYRTCNGERQSPVDIPKFSVDVKDVVSDTHPAFAFTNYDVDTVEMKAINDGHTVKVEFANTIPSVSGGGLPETYKAAQMHLHWGSDDMQGSEHTMNTKMYPMELHIVHYASSRGSLGDAAGVTTVGSQGLAVLGFFFEVQAADNPALTPIMNKLSLIPDKAASPQILSSFSLDSILPTEAERKHYFRYNGGLTTPPCYESVIWTVFGATIKISRSQLAQFRVLLSSEKNSTGNGYWPMVDNWRPVQALKQRVVTAYVPKWAYNNKDGYHADNWGKYYPYCDDETPRSPGKLPRQSPINIDSTTVSYSLSIKNIIYGNYNNEDVEMKLYNNGHTAVIDILTNHPTISGGGLPPGTFQAAQFHFHWGSQDSQGSEHLINNMAYPMELHIVHWSTIYTSIGEAMVKPDGLAVLGFMFKVSTSDNENLTAVVSKLADVVQPVKTNKVALDRFSLNQFLSGLNMEDYFRYDGSLTTAPCYESVTWTVFEDSIPISQAQLQQFRNMKSVETDNTGALTPMVDNYRPPMKRHGRRIMATFFVGAATFELRRLKEQL